MALLQDLIQQIDDPKKKYSVIYADPPWSYATARKSGSKLFLIKRGKTTWKSKHL